MGPGSQSRLPSNAQMTYNTWCDSPYIMNGCLGNWGAAFLKRAFTLGVYFCCSQHTPCSALAQATARGKWPVRFWADHCRSSTILGGLDPNLHMPGHASGGPRVLVGVHSGGPSCMGSVVVNGCVPPGRLNNLHTTWYVNYFLV